MVYVSLYFLQQILLMQLLSTCNLPRFNLSLIFLIVLFLSNSAKISFVYFLLISETVLLVTAKISNTLCWPISIETKSFFYFLARGIISLHQAIFLQEFSPQKCRAKLVMVTNQSVCRPPPTSYAYSQAKHFFPSNN